MAEEKEEPEKQTEEENGEEGTGKKPRTEDKADPEKKANNLIDNATAAADRLEKANEKHEALLVRQEALRAEEKLAGKANAGQATKQEESDSDYAKRVMEGNIDDKQGTV